MSHGVSSELSGYRHRLHRELPHNALAVQAKPLSRELLLAAVVSDDLIAYAEHSASGRSTTSRRQRLFEEAGFAQDSLNLEKESHNVAGHQREGGTPWRPLDDLKCFQ